MDPKAQKEQKKVTYPHLQNYSQEDKEWLQKISSVSPQSQQIPNQPYNQPSQQPTMSSSEMQVIKQHTIRSHKPWKELVKETVDWVNTNIHPMRIISFSVVMCHSTGAGQCTIFYDDSKSTFINFKIKGFLEYALSGVLIESTKTWQNHHQEVTKLAMEFVTEGKIMVGISELETNYNHNRASSILWFLKKY